MSAAVSIGRFALVALVLILGSGWLLTLGFSGPGDARAIRVSGSVALVVQVLSFAVVRLAAGQNVLVGWGIGALVRFAVLIGYALLVVGALGLPPAAALISLATFFFLCTLVEPLLLTS